MGHLSEVLMKIKDLPGNRKGLWFSFVGIRGGLFCYNRNKI